MKNIWKIGFAVCFLAAAVACEDAEYGVIENMVYISEAAPNNSANQQIGSLTIKGDTETSFTVRMARAVDADVTATVIIDPSIVEEYNKANGANYQVLPSEYLSFEEEVVIPAGNIAAAPTKVAIKRFDTPNGESYAIPFRVAEVEGAPVASVSSKWMLLLDKPLIQRVPIFTAYHVPHSDVENSPWNLTTAEWTLETLLNMDSFGVNNQAIFNFNASVEVYIRFGDAGKDYNMLQIKHNGSQVDSNYRFDTNTWYHIAFVSSGGSVRLYVNGKEDVALNAAPPSVTFNGIQLASSGTQYFRARAQYAQVRFWSKSLTEAQLQANMHKAVSASLGGLEAYWKMDEGEGATFADATGKGRTLTCTGSYVPTWAPEFDFSSL